MEKYYAALNSSSSSGTQEPGDDKGSIHIVVEIVSGINLPVADRIVGSVSTELLLRFAGCIHVVVDFSNLALNDRFM